MFGKFLGVLNNKTALEDLNWDQAFEVEIKIPRPGLEFMHVDVTYSLQEEEDSDPEYVTSRVQIVTDDKIRVALKYEDGDIVPAFTHSLNPENEYTLNMFFDTEDALLLLYYYRTSEPTQAESTLVTNVW